MQEAEMTLNEATARPALYRRERDAANYRATVFSDVAAENNLLRIQAEMRLQAAQVMQRPGIQNGLRKIEEMEAGR